MELHIFEGVVEEFQRLLKVGASENQGSFLGVVTTTRSILHLISGLEWDL